MTLYSTQQLESVGMTLPFVGWTSKFIKRNMWRFHGQLDADDLWQELLIVFLRVKKRYQDVEAKHLMALFKISVLNRVNSMSRRYVPFEENSSDIGIADTHDEWLELGAALSFAPTDMQDLVMQLFSDYASLSRGGKLSESSVRAYFGFDRKRKPLAELRQLFSNSEYSMASRALALTNPEARASQPGAFEMTGKSKLIDELVKAANFTADATKSDAQTLEDIAYELNDLSDAEYKKMSKEAVSWFDSAVVALDESKPLKAPEGFKEWFAAVKKEANAKPKSASKKTSKKVDAKGKEGITGKRKRGDGVVRAATVFYLENGRGTKPEDVVAHLAKSNMTISPFTAKRAIGVARRTMNIMYDTGWFSKTQAAEFLGR